MGESEVPALSTLAATPAQRMLIRVCLDNGVPFFWRGPGTLLIAQPGLAGILRDMTVSGAIVLGFEGFEIESTDLHPRLDLIFDASRRPDANPAQVASDWPADVWIDVAIRLP